MKTLRRLLKQRHGSVVALFAAMLSVLVGLTALVVDLGLLYTTRVQLTNLADAAALAGVQELPDNSGGAYSRAADYAQLNGKMGDVLDIQVLNGTTVAVKATRTVPLMFARIFGLATSDVTGAAAARISPASGVRGIVPFSLIYDPTAPFVYGQKYTIKFDKFLSPGNFGLLDLGGNLRENIMYGYDGTFDFNTPLVFTEPGGKVGIVRQSLAYRFSLDPTNPTFATVTPGSSRIILVPVIESMDVNGKKEVKVLGFAAMFLSESSDGKSVTGQFMQMVTAGIPDDGAGNYGVYASRLVPYSSAFN
ncbi:MAG: pilus assembly protein [Veillonellaceae bacterium]|nr:pilus assembly protein [Veillonellaceae bacterium]